MDNCPNIKILAIKDAPKMGLQYAIEKLPLESLNIVGCADSFDDAIVALPDFCPRIKTLNMLLTGGDDTKIWKAERNIMKECRYLRQISHGYSSWGSVSFSTS